jgi:hypothetical protein
LKLHTISSLRRHTEGDILFAGCLGKIAVLLWAFQQFHLVNLIPFWSPNPVTDICFEGNAIFAVGDSNKGVAVYFDDNCKLLRGRNAPG